MPNNPLTASGPWKNLQAHQAALQDVHMRDLFRQDGNRFDRFHIKLDGFIFDYSKHRITTETRTLLIALAEARDLGGAIQAMNQGQKINTTEGRAAMHMALRNSHAAPDIAAFVAAQRTALARTAEKIRADASITDIVHIGTGGSDLGPRMICRALHAHVTGPRAHFVNNIDAGEIKTILQNLRPENTIFVLASKAFSTAETLLNMQTARSWLETVMSAEQAVSHFYAVTENVEAARLTGIGDHQILPLRDWIGGRFSLWSSIGLTVAATCGFEVFEDLLQGAAIMDAHFMTTDFDRNIPVMMALIGIWYRNFWDFRAHAVVPYAQALDKFPAYIQQLDMESNGKTVDLQGETVTYKTAPAILGDVGTNAQHAFFQFFHQGSDIVPCDFIIGAADPHGLPEHHAMLVCNALAQGEALMQGLENAEAPHRHFSGNRPSSTFLLDRLDARHLGMLIAAYEHKIFVQGVVWNINSFDQWGVELGKTLARRLIAGFGDNTPLDNLDSSTAHLLAALKAKNG